MKKKWKIILSCIIAVVILGITVYESIRPLEAELLEVKPGPIAKTFEEEGKVVPGVERPIYATYGGKINSLPVSEGQEVAEGDLLAVIDSRELELQMNRLKAQLRSTEGEMAGEFAQPYELKLQSQQLQVDNAEQEFEYAETNFRRMKQLFAAKAISKKEYEDAQKMFNIARNNLDRQKAALSLLTETHKPGSGLSRYYEGMKDAIRAQIDLMQYKIETNRIKAPINGVVAELNVKKGEMVSPQAPIMKVFQNDMHLVEVFVLTEDVPGVETGMNVELVLENNDSDIKFEGTVTKIAPAAVEKMSALGLEEQRVKVTVEPDIPKNLELRPGYVLDVKFTTDQKENQLVVPKTALFPYKDGDALWVVRNGKAQIQPVKKGFENDRDVAIKQGLNKGDMVILNPQLKGLEEGKRVVPGP